jgi:hypothetical protein
MKKNKTAHFGRISRKYLRIQKDVRRPDIGQAKVVNIIVNGDKGVLAHELPPINLHGESPLRNGKDC